MNVDSCSIQEIVVPYLHICRTKVKECVATDSEFGRNKAVSKTNIPQPKLNFVSFFGL